MNRKIFLYNAFIFITFAGVLSLASCSNETDNQKTESKSAENWIQFDWIGDSVSNKYFDKLAIAIPFSIEGIPHKFQSQLDLGAISTMVYGNTIEPYLIKYPEVAKKLDTVSRDYMPGYKASTFKQINFRLDAVEFKNQDLIHLEKFGDEMTIDSVDTKTLKHIGTVAPDLFQDGSLMIDFPNQRLAILDSLETNRKKNTVFVDVKIDKGRIKIPVTINDSVRYFMFDTGSSMFPLIVLKEEINTLSNAQVANDTLEVSTWGSFYNVHGYEISSNIQIGGVKIDSKNLNVYDTRKEFTGFFEQEGIMGIMGNSFFLDKTILIDYQNKRLGIVN